MSLDDYLNEEYSANVDQLPRQWELTELGAHYQAEVDVPLAQGNRRPPVTFTLMSYNILAQDLINLNPCLYTLSTPDSLDWKQRRRRLMAEIAHHNADILNLQEVQEDQYNDYIKPRLEKLGYVGCYQKRTGDKTDGCATLWKEAMFHLLGSSAVTYCRGGLLDRDNVALVVELRPIRAPEETPPDPEDKLVVSNTHLLFNPKRGDIKLAQLMILMAEIDKHAYLGSSPDRPHASPPSSWDSLGRERYCPVIMSGDFNMEPFSDLYRFIINGSLKYEGLLVREMSGQEERRNSRNWYLQKHFLSPMFGVTDLCQYHNVVVQRLKQSYQAHADTSLSPGGVDTESSQGSMGQCDGQDSTWQASQQQDKESGNSSCVDGILRAERKEDCGSDGERKGDSVCSVEQKRKSNCDVERKGERCSDDEHTSHSPSSSPLSPVTPSSSGCLSHGLNLFTAHRHKVGRLGGKEDEVTTHHSQAECTVDFVFYSVDYKDVCVMEEELEVRVVEEGHLKLLGRYGLMSGEELDNLGGIPNSMLPSDHLCLLTKFLLL